MSLVIREMGIDEVHVIIDYFHGSTVDHLEMLGVDPTQLPTPPDWRERYVGEYEKPVQVRSTMLSTPLGRGGSTSSPRTSVWRTCGRWRRPGVPAISPGWWR